LSIFDETKFRPSELRNRARAKSCGCEGPEEQLCSALTGSIAAYKSAELASLLVKQGHNVFAVMTHDATEFITPLTLQTAFQKSGDD